MRLTRKIDGKTVNITLTQEELSQAHAEYVKNFIKSELISQYHLSQVAAEEVAQSAYEAYCRGDGYTEYDCLNLEYNSFYEESMIHDIENFSNLVHLISDGRTSEEYSLFTVKEDTLIEAYAANERMFVEIVSLSELSLPENKEDVRRAIEKNTIALFANRISFVFEMQPPAYSSDVADFHAEVIPIKDKWKCGSTSLGLLLDDLGLL